MTGAGLRLLPTGETVTLSDGREARGCSAFISGHGPGYVSVSSGHVSEAGPWGPGCLVETPEGELWAVRALTVSLARKHLDTEEGTP